MQVQYTIELRVDVPSDDLREPIRVAAMRAMVKLNAYAQVAAQCQGHAVQPKIAMWSDDYFTEQKEISLDEALAIVRDEEAEASLAEKTAPVSASMLDALKSTNG